MQPTQIYDHRRASFQRLQENRQRMANRLSNARLVTGIIGLVAAPYLYRSSGPTAGLSAGMVAILVFCYLVFRHGRVRRHLRYVAALRGINNKGMERAAGRWGAFSDTGADYRDDDHAYASDLDLFGNGSLFQWITSATTVMGRASLAQLLKQPPPDLDEIQAKQQAVTELARKLAWRQRFEAEGLLAPERTAPVESLLQWADIPHQAYARPVTRLAIRLLPVATTFTLGLSALGGLPRQLPAMLIVIQVLLLLTKGKQHSQILSVLYRQEAHLKSYARMLKLFERHRFEAPWIRQRQARLRDSAGRSASHQLAALSKIVQRMANRENALFAVLNILLLWDFQCMVSLARWKHESGQQLNNWLRTLADIEALSSLANIRFEHPDWAVPTVVEDRDQVTGLSARHLGHPLITHGRVCNNFELTPAAPMALITGSNMAGKSTFLRTVGINLVLAYAGAPVCAEVLRCSKVTLWTSMRTTDNLEQSVSSFYAEVLRIKRIVDAARENNRVLCLLDEVFKGTNSHDRHQGARALINQLLGQGALGLVSTHDLELGDLERESQGRIKNLHFREYYRDGELHFDYKLRPGVATTTNALYLIEMMGIKVQQTDGI